MVVLALSLGLTDLMISHRTNGGAKGYAAGGGEDTKLHRGTVG